MKKSKNYLSKICALLIILSANYANAQNNLTRFEWVSHTTFDTIKNIGQKHLFYQRCDPQSDSLIANGILVFKNTSILNIPQCKYEISIIDTVIKSITISTNSKPNTAELRIYATKLCGELNLLFRSNKYINYLSVRLLNKKPCAVLYLESKNKKKGKLIIVSSDV